MVRCPLVSAPSLSVATARVRRSRRQHGPSVNILTIRLADLRRLGYTGGRRLNAKASSMQTSNLAHGHAYSSCDWMSYAERSHTLRWLPRIKQPA